jgi:Bifunctional DNA primase/polymerase, N-terminal
VGGVKDLRQLRERHGRCYGELHLALTFTRSLGLEDDDFKTVYGWKSTRPLPDGDYGAALLAGRGEKRNPAVCLRASGLLGVDIDGEAGRALVRELVPVGLPPTVAVRSGRADGGLHLWYRAPQAAAKVKVQFASKLTLSADGYFIVPPGWHAQAPARYAFLEGRAPWETEIARFSARLLEELVARAGRDDEDRRADDASPIAPGERHPHLLRIGGAMRRAGAGEPSIAAALLSENERRCQPPKPDGVVRALARDICTRYPPGTQPSRLQKTEKGQGAERLPPPARERLAPPTRERLGGNA